MKFKALKDDVLAASSMVTKAISSRVVQEIMKNVYVEAHSEGYVLLRATNGVLTIDAKFGATVTEEGCACFDPMVFQTIGHYDGEKPISFSVKKRLTITQGRRRNSNAIVPGDDFPEAHYIDTWHEVDVADLKHVFEKTCIAASAIADLPIAAGVYLNASSGYILASDGNQVVTNTLNLPDQDGVVVPSARYLLSLLPFFKGYETIEMHIGDRLAFRSHDWEASLLGLSGNFPVQVRDHALTMADKKATVRMCVDTQELLSALDVCALYSQRAEVGGKNYYAELGIENNEASISIEVAEVGSAVEPLTSAELDGADKFVIRFHPVALRECVDVVQSDTTEMVFFETLAPFIVRDDADPDFVYMQVPIVRTGIGDDAEEDPRIAAKRDKKEEPVVADETERDEDETFDW